MTFLALQILPVKERGGTKISLVMSKEGVCSGNQFVSNSFSLFPATNQIAERRNFFNSGTISQRIHGDDNPEFLHFGQKSFWQFFLDDDANLLPDSKCLFLFGLQKYPPPVRRSELNLKLGKFLGKTPLICILAPTFPFSIELQPKGIILESLWNDYPWTLWIWAKKMPKNFSKSNL